MSTPPFNIVCAGPGPHADDAPNGVICEAAYDPSGDPSTFCTSDACQKAAQGYTG